MSLALLVATLLTGPPAPAPAGCDSVAAVLAAAQEQGHSGEFAAAAAQLRGRHEEVRACRELAVASWAWEGWLAADDAAAHGGTEAALTRVRAALAALEFDAAGPSAAAYAVALLHAAAAAAQDERDELQVWLEHARDLAARRALVHEPSRWPLPIDLAEGELWSSVDDYELAEASYARALATHDGAAAWRGLARARDRRGNRPGACAAYRRALEAATATAPRGVVASEARGYLLVCER